MAVEFIKGRKPVLTIYEDGAQREEVELATYTSVDALHALFVEKGFHKKGGESGKVIAGESDKVIEAETSKEMQRKAEAVNEQPPNAPELNDDIANVEDNAIFQGFGMLTGVAIVAYGVRMRKVKTRSV